MLGPVKLRCLDRPVAVSLEDLVPPDHFYRHDEPLPDHSSLSKIRTRLGLPIFRRFFEHVVELCQQAGLVWGQELFFDGTKVRANAAIDSLQSRWSVAARA